MIPRSHLITLDQVIIGICKTTNSTNSLIVRVVCNVGLTVRAPARAYLLGEYLSCDTPGIRCIDFP